MTRLAATICWGVIALLTLMGDGLLLADGQGQARRPPPRRPVSAKQPAVQPYQLDSSVDLDVPGPVSLVAGRSHLIVVSGFGPVIGFTLPGLSKAWTYDAEIVPSPSAPVVAGDGLAFITSAGWIRAIDEETGRPRWRILADGRIAPIVSGGWLIVTSDQAIRAYRAADGTLVWQQELGSPVVAPMSLDGERIFAVLADRLLVSLDLPTGTLRWVKTLDVTASAPLAANGRVYFGASDGNFYCYAQESDELAKWTFLTRVGVIGRPVTDGTRVYVAGYDNAVRALDAHTGNLRWKSDLVSRPSGQLFIEAGHVVIPLTSGDLELRLTEDGRPAGALLPLRPAGNEGMQLEGVASADLQQIFRVTASTGGHKLDAYRRGALPISVLGTPPGRPVELRAPHQPPAHP